LSKLKKYLSHKPKKTQQDFAEIVGTTPTHIGRLISGKCIPSLQMAIEIENATGGLVTVYDWLPPEYSRVQKKTTDTEKADDHQN